MQRRCNDDAVKRRSKVNSPSFCQFSPSSPSRYNALLAECDPIWIASSTSALVSIHALLAECDVFPHILRLFRRVSIHALLAECDNSLTATKNNVDRFNPRTPCGVRLAPTAITDDCMAVSIHALLAECDGRPTGDQNQGACFNPRTPCGVRLRPTLYIATQQSKSYFAPTSLKRPSLHGCSF